MNERLVEAGVHHQRNELDAFLARAAATTRGSTFPVIAPRLSNEKTCGETIEICVGVGEEAPRARVAARRIPQRLELLRVRAAERRRTRHATVSARCTTVRPSARFTCT